jgi:acetyltransferase
MDLEKLFKPDTMAVIGVSSTNEAHPANVIYNKNRLRYEARAFAVNPRGGRIRGDILYERLGDIPEKIDLAVIAVKAELVLPVVEECISAGVRGAVIISGGFAETGLGDLQNRLANIAREAQFPFIGPNCLGVYAAPRMDTFFIPSERMVRPEKGRVTMISQSGGVVVDQLVKAAAEGVGVSTAISIGNKALIKEADLLHYFSTDPETDVITFYIEGFGKNEGREFALAATQCSKPIIVLKAGKTAAGNKAVSSHTASMAGNYEVFSSVMAQKGVVEAKDEFELMAFAESLSCYPRNIKGNIGIITGSGGHGAICTDACISHGLVVPVLGEETRQALKEALSPVLSNIASYVNPVDLTGSSTDDDFLAAARVLSRDQGIDCIIMLLLPYIPGITVDLGAKLGMMHQQEEKPIIAYVPHVEKYKIVVEGFNFYNIPVAHSVEDAVHMADAMRRNKPC